MEKNSHLKLGKMSPRTESHTSTKCHEIFGPNMKFLPLFILKKEKRKKRKKELVIKSRKFYSKKMDKIRNSNLPPIAMD